MPARTRSLVLDTPLDTFLSFALHRHGPHDPTIRLSRRELWRATRTPDGPGTIRLEVVRCEVRVTAWGPGEAWLVEHAPLLAGAGDRSRLQPIHPVLRDLQRRTTGLRIGASRAVVEALVPAILEQKVTSVEAHASYRRLVRALGEPAPGPRPLVLPPAPEVLAAQPYWVFHRFGIERRRAEIIRAVCARARRIEECIDLPRDEAERRLRSFTGIGPWTVAEVAARAMGDPDAVSVGDFHLPHLVTWVLAGEARGSDARMLELLEPYRGERGRVTRIIEAAGTRPPRRAPRRRIRAIASM